MKTIIQTLIISVVIMSYAHAQAPVMLHHNGVATPYFTYSGLQNAYTDAANGDTIYIPGGFFSGITLNKRLVLFGTGHYPDSLAATGRGQYNGDLTLGANCDSSHIEGLYITGSIVQTASNIKIDNITIRRNLIDGNLTMDGNRSTPSMFPLIYGNVIRGNVDLSNTLQATLCNNIFNARIHYIYQGVIRNNIFTGDVRLGCYYCVTVPVYDCDLSLIENNIFLNTYWTASNFQYAYCENSVIRRNMYSSSVDYTNNTSSNEYTSVHGDSILVNLNGPSFTYTQDFHLKYPVRYFGQDSTPVGIYGGFLPYRYKEAAMPVNPHIREKNIAAQTDSLGNLQIMIKVGAQQN